MIFSDVYNSKDKVYSLSFALIKVVYLVLPIIYHSFWFFLQHGHPYVSAMVNNGSYSYDHDRDGTHTELAGCESQFRKAKHETYIAIRYERDKLTVSVKSVTLLLKAALN